jgi:hypothetical protein
MNRVEPLLLICGVETETTEENQNSILTPGSRTLAG